MPSRLRPDGNELTVTLPNVWWCSACGTLDADAVIDVEPVTDRPGRQDMRGQHRACGTEALRLTPPALFCELALDAIPHELIATPAVGAGDVRRQALASVLWPAVEVILALHGPGSGKGAELPGDGDTRGEADA